MIHHATNSFFLRLIGISLCVALFGLFGAYSGTEANAQAKSEPKTSNAFSEAAT